MTAIASVDAVVVVSPTAAYATSADKMSFIAINPGLGSVDIVGGWSGTTATPAEVSHSAYFFESFLPLYEGTILANVNADVVGPGGLLHQMWIHSDLEAIAAGTEVMSWGDAVAMIPPSEPL